MSTEPKDTGTTLTFGVSMSTDRDHFLRLTCPSCGRDFKTEIDTADLQWALAAQCRRMGLEIGANDDKPSPASRLRCPYCSQEGEARDMHTAETVAYLKHLIFREYMFPQFQRMFSGLGDSFGSGRSGGLVSFSLEVSRSLLPTRPLHGPEPADMKIVAFLCCSKKMKIAETWHHIDTCPFCGTGVQIF